MSKTLVAIPVMAAVIFVAQAAAQTQAPPAGQSPPSGAQTPAPQTPAPQEDRIVRGEVGSIDPAGTAITLTDGTKLVTPPGASIRPGVLKEGMTVIASYKEENGEKVMSELAVADPSASPPTEPRSPGEPSPAPPPASPKRQ
jgi:hypothetical protein